MVLAFLIVVGVCGDPALSPMGQGAEGGGRKAGALSRSKDGCQGNITLIESTLLRGWT